MNYYYIKSKNLFARSRNSLDNDIYQNGQWVKDTQFLVSDRLLGYDPYDDSPYGFGGFEYDIEQISEDEFEKYRLENKLDFLGKMIKERSK